MVSYDKQTLNTPNPIARYAHRNRLLRSLSLVIRQTGARKILDYGCGSGAFIGKVNEASGLEAFGYEPFMEERVEGAKRIFDKIEPLYDIGPFDVITIFETIEHLNDYEILEFLGYVEKLLVCKGKVLFSAPIEIGPSLIMKEFNRCVLHRRSPEYGIGEFFLASVFGLAAKRPDDFKHSHKGFDFRRATRFLEEHFGPVEIESYGPLPIGTWYGNSQVYFWLTKR